MRNNNCKNQPRNQQLHTPQLPTQVVAKTQFQTLLAEFFDSNDGQGHISNLTKLCQAFTGVRSEDPITHMDIANMVFWTDVIKDFIRQVSSLWALPESGITDTDSHLLDSVLFSNKVNRIIEVLGSSLQDWISPTEPPSTIDELNEGVFLFQTASDLIKTCNRIYLRAEKR